MADRPAAVASWRVRGFGPVEGWPVTNELSSPFASRSCPRCGAPGAAGLTHVCPPPGSDSWTPPVVTPLRLIDVPQHYFPDKVGPGSFDPNTLRAAAEAHCRHPFDHAMEIKAWVVLYLLDVYEAAAEAADWHEGKSGHITDRNVVDAVRGVVR